MPVVHDDLFAKSWNTNLEPYPFEDSLTDYTKNTDVIEYVLLEVPENNHPPSLKFPKNSAGRPMEQTTEREEESNDEEIQHEET